MTPFSREYLSYCSTMDCRRSGSTWGQVCLFARVGRKVEQFPFAGAMGRAQFQDLPITGKQRLLAEQLETRSYGIAVYGG